MYALLLVALLAPAASVAVEPELVAVEYTVLSSGQLQVSVDTQGEIPAPKIFRTSQPDRIILDYLGVKSSVNPRIREVKRGAVDSVVVIGVEERARIIVNLVSSVPFESQQSDSEIILLIGQVVSGQRTESGRSGLGLQDGVATVSDPHHVTTVDFRRGTNGSGRVIIGLDRENVQVMVREELGKIVLDFANTVLGDDLERRLDVFDFATPVQFVDTFSLDERTRIVLSALGAYDFVGFQSGKTFSVEVTPRADDAETKAADDDSYIGSPISFDFQNISVRGALQIIAEETGINFVISDSVAGDLTLRLKDVPWDQALETIMQIKGLAKREKNNVIWIAPAEEITAKERLVLESSLQMTELEPLISDLIQINYARAEDIAELLKSVRAVGPNVQPSMFGSVSIAEVQTETNSLLSDRGSVTVDARTNTLLIQDMAGKILEVRKLISELDRPVKQVLIETRIVIANEDFSRNIGAKLGLTSINDSGSIIGSGSLSNTATVRTDGINASGDGSLSVNLPATGINGDSPASYAVTLAKAGAGWAALIDLEISALEAEGNGKIVANPRLLTADKQEAHIEQGQERIFTTSTQGEGGVVTKKAVLSLTVTPQITPDDHVILDVFVTKDSFVSPTEENINTLQVKTQVLLENGETVVIGGIYEQQSSKTVSKVPWLGDLPLVGKLFKKKGILDNRRELLIFLTPRIINPALTGG